LTALQKQKYTLEEYLELDANSEERLEYWDGEIFSMSGVSSQHVSQFIKQPDNSWLNLEFNSLGDTLKVVTLGCELTLDEIYQDVSFPPISTGSFLL
jgi:Uma2 family endonuclease